MFSVAIYLHIVKQSYLMLSGVIMKFDTGIAGILISCAIGYSLGYSDTVVGLGVLGSFLIIDVGGYCIDRYRNDA